jgi:hypothetical protein
VVPGHDKGSQLGVWFLRNFLIYDSQTFAITSGTTNCVDEGSRYSTLEQETFITLNLASLTKEAAQGQGQHLNALGQIYGCSDVNQFSQFSQKYYIKIYDGDSASSINKNYRQLILNDPTLEKQCLPMGETPNL